MDNTVDSIFFLEGTQRDGDVSLSPRDVPGTPSRGGDDDFFEDGSIFSQSPNLFMTPGTEISWAPGKRKMTPSTKESLLFKSPEPGEKKKKVVARAPAEESLLFLGLLPPRLPLASSPPLLPLP